MHIHVLCRAREARYDTGCTPRGMLFAASPLSRRRRRLRRGAGAGGGTGRGGAHDPSARKVDHKGNRRRTPPYLGHRLRERPLYYILAKRAMVWYIGANPRENAPSSRLKKVVNNLLRGTPTRAYFFRIHRTLRTWNKRCAGENEEKIVYGDFKDFRYKPCRAGGGRGKKLFPVFLNYWMLMGHEHTVYWLENRVPMVKSSDFSSSVVHFHLWLI